MPVLKNLIKCDFTQLPNELLQTNKLSLEAKAILIELLSYSNEYKISENFMQKNYRISETWEKTIFTELQQKGYLFKKNNEWFVSPYPLSEEDWGDFRKF